MKIEVGKFYKTRNGNKVRIYAIDGGNSGDCIHGAFLTLYRKWLSSSWLQNGKCIEYGVADSYDIISEWEEPRPRMLAWMNTFDGHILMRKEDIQMLDCIRMPHLDEPT